MRLTTFGGILVIGMAGAAIAQVTQVPHAATGAATMTQNMAANSAVVPTNEAAAASDAIEPADAPDPLPGNAVGTPTEAK